MISVYELLTPPVSPVDAAGGALTARDRLIATLLTGTVVNALAEAPDPEAAWQAVQAAVDGGMVDVLRRRIAARRPA